MKTTSAKYSSPPSSQRNPSSTPAGPLNTLRLGRIKATIWENGSDERAFCSVTFARTYVDEEKRFRDADSFGRDDLLLVAKLADQAHTFICERQSAQKSEEAAENHRRA